MSEVRPQRRLLSAFMSKNVPPVPETPEQRRPFPSKRNPFLLMFFWWLHPVMRVGYKRTLTPEDMFVLDDPLKVETMAAKFSAEFYSRLETHYDKLEASGTTIDPENPPPVPRRILLAALYKTFFVEYTLAIIYLLFLSSAGSTMPLVSKKLIAFVELRALGLEPHIGPGIGYALGCPAMVLTLGVLVNHCFNNSMLVGAKVKAVLTKAILDKLFRLNEQLRHKYSLAKITSMMGTDLARMDFAIGFQPFLITFPVPVAICIGILCNNIGGPAMVGIGIILLFIFIMTFIGKALFAYRNQASVFTDARVSSIKEVLAHLKMIKFYSWEAPYFERISKSRKDEMNVIWKMQVVRNIIISLAMSMSLFASMASFLTVWGTTSSTKTPADIFSSLALFASLSQQVFMLPIALSAAADAMVGVARVSLFLAAPEADKQAMSTRALPEMEAKMLAAGTAISISNGTFKWEVFAHEEEEKEDDEKDKKSKKKKGGLFKKKQPAAIAEKASLSDEDQGSPVTVEKHSYSKSEDTESSSATAMDATIFESLRNINLDIKKGEFVAVTGVIGSGKTSLLNAMAGFMARKSGSLSTVGLLLLCGVPWIQNATVKENILFGNSFDEERYKQVIYACSLEADLAILPAGDQTEIGERGITLSGGQKARINLARAVYDGTDTILLDDVLSAVDARVGKHIMKTCLMGLLKDKTRVLATHQLSLIGDVDRVLFLNGDGSLDVGTFDELLARNAGFKQLMEFNITKEKEEEEEKVEAAEDREIEKEIIARQVSRQLSRPNSEARSNVVEDEEANHQNYELNRDKDGHLIDEEGRAVNQIRLLVLVNYIRYGSGIFKHFTAIPVLIIFTALAVFCQLFTNTWLSFWTELKFAHRGADFYIGIYVMFTVISFIFLSIQFNLVAYLTNGAAKNLNILAVKRVLRVPMVYMDTTPMGRILNRFTKDTDTLDNEISNSMRMATYFASNIVGVIILCIIYLPWFAIAVPPLAFIFIAISNFYQASAREIKRLEATQRSLVYNNFNETLSGMETIKAYNREAMFLQKNDRLVDQMNECYFFTITNQRWLAIHLDFVATLMSLVVALLCVFRVFDISSSAVGLLLTYVLQIAGQLSLLVRMVTQVENELNSVERISEYAFELPQEAPELISELTPRETWPETGSIRFENVNLAYRPGLPLVLKNLNMDIGNLEKIGICGRTGAGKSSIMTALFRLTELNSGRIEIDGVDISTLGLHDLRSKLSIIPQDPVLFQGNIRKNLDPFGFSSDEHLWESLSRAGLIEPSKLNLVKAQSPTDENLHKFHLDRDVEDNGSNFSLGERQLISFARALVRGSKILILDEATSSVDYETDNKIQETIVREFKDCTILCIAHRLKTIVHYDRILVLDKGEIQGFDTPWNLFNLKGSIFHQMCVKSNITEQDFIH